MERSPYLKVYPYEDKPDHCLLYSTKKSSLILLKEKTLQKIDQGTLSPSDEALLKKLGMVVDDREEEKRTTLSVVDQLNKNNPELQVVVVLNLDCNFACLYCYEGDMKGNFFLTDQTAQRLIEFIKGRFTTHKKALRIDFYGGEPLLSVNVIKSISSTLKSYIESKGGTYGFTLVTNGSFFNRKIARELVPLGLDGVKITLDGPAEIHNKYRPFKSGAGSFDIIIRNMKETWDLAPISLGGNFEKTNYKDFPRLLDYLLKEDLTPEKIPVVKFDPVMSGPQGNHAPTDYRGGCMSINEPWILEASSLLREEILKRGYHTPKMAPMFCMIENADGFVVNFDGTIYKCPAFIGHEAYAIGDLETGLRDYRETHKLDIWKNEECLGCEYLPLCFGGCRYMTFMRNGTIDALDCKKPHLDAFLETAINQDMKYRLKANRH